MSYKSTAPEISVNNSVMSGIAIKQLSPYMGKYELTFQFWGADNNNVFIEKDGIELYDSGGFATPYEAMADALKYLERVSPGMSIPMNEDL